NGPSGIITLPPTSVNPYALGYVAADDNKFGYVLLPAPPCHVTLDRPERFFDAKGQKVAICVGHSNCRPTATASDSLIPINEIGCVPETMICAFDFTSEPNTSP